ncbi:prolactin-like [Hemiscyllium ocellatum]|uniref:prolactin-like n=1 Tax=Hemiscyllium ocellatum TaxID=170820 RepID=UPI002965EB4A|nr:prolactin-like [Hemiscyllium ocellatum]
MATPICANEGGECRTISVSELFHRAGEISHQIHALSTEAYNEFNQHFIQGQHLNFSIINSCHTSSIVTPQNKEDALRTPHKRLLSLVIAILRSWQDPLQYVISEFSATHGNTSSILSKSVKIVKQMKRLAKGLNKISEQVGQHSGAIEQTVPWEQPLDEDGDSLISQLYNLLHCFRRDTNKIDTYLKLLKCRFTQKLKC